ncbi:MAG: hypothetical protein ACI977_000008 [Candidatus Nanohaloarchaea archaeon]|jgi:hypothetical protein
MADRDTETYLKVLNSLLAVGFVLMLGNYLGLSPGITGNFFAVEEEPSCKFNHGEESNSIPMERCCYHASQQLKIGENEEKFFYGSQYRNYSLNQEAVEYCSEEDFDIE